MTDIAHIHLAISVDEWRDVATWMHRSIDRDEQSPRGHFLLECQGGRRTWVASDGGRMTVVHVDGQPPRGLRDPDEVFTVLLNSRLFRGCRPQDAVITIAPSGDGRAQTLAVDGVRTTLPEHPGDFGDWRAILAQASGATAEIATAVFREACMAASVAPWGTEEPATVHAWLWIEDGRLHVEAPWTSYPSTTIDAQLLAPADDTAPVLVDTGALIELLMPIELERLTLLLPIDDPMGAVGIRSDRYQAVLMPVDRWGRERAFVEGLICEFLDVEEVTADADGDYPVVTPEGHQLWVRLNTAAEPMSVQVFAVLASNVEPAPGMFEELNSINADAAHVKVLWAGGAVMAEVDLVAETLNLAELANALRVVRRTAERYHEVLSAFFGQFPSGDEPLER